MSKECTYSGCCLRWVNMCWIRPRGSRSISVPRARARWSCINVLEILYTHATMCTIIILSRWWYANCAQKRCGKYHLIRHESLHDYVVLLLYWYYYFSYTLRAKFAENKWPRAPKVKTRAVWCGIKRASNEFLWFGTMYITKYHVPSYYESCKILNERAYTNLYNIYYCTDCELGYNIHTTVAVNVNIIFSLYHNNVFICHRLWREYIIHSLIYCILLIFMPNHDVINDQQY